jgi:acetyl esterase/lipase
VITGRWPGSEDVTFASGKWECAAWLSIPDGDGPHPCVVMGHGFSLTRHDSLAQYAEIFAAAGLAVLAFDYRYFGDSTGVPRQRFRRPEQYIDFGNAVSYVRNLPQIDASRIALWGFSFGGGHAIQVSIDEDDIAAVMVLCPFVDGFRRVLATRPGLAAWITPRAIADLMGRWITIPVTSQPGGHGAMSLHGEADGFAATVDDAGPWRNEVSPGIFLSVGLFRPVVRAPEVLVPLWVGRGEFDITTHGPSVERLAVNAQDGELHRYDADHFGVFEPVLASQIAHDQVKFLRRTGVLSEETPARMQTNLPGAG